MAVDKELWNKSFGALDPKTLPNWPCPSCGKTQVVLDNKAIIYRQNKVQYPSDDFKKEDFEERTFLGFVIALVSAYEKLQFIQHKFVGFLICKECGEPIGFGGRAEIPSESLWGQHRISSYTSPARAMFFSESEGTGLPWSWANWVWIAGSRSRQRVDQVSAWRG